MHAVWHVSYNHPSLMLAFNDVDSRRKYDANDEEALNIKEYFTTFS